MTKVADKYRRGFESRATAIMRAAGNIPQTALSLTLQRNAR